MPNGLVSWNKLNNVGNPTKSIEINDLIKAVKKTEVRKQGKASTPRHLDELEGDGGGNGGGNGVSNGGDPKAASESEQLQEIYSQMAYHLGEDRRLKRRS
jgi:hypothetical protein